MNRKFQILLYGLAITLGLATALLGVIKPGTNGLSNEAAAQVNGVVISSSDYAAAVSARQAEKREPLDGEDRTRALERLIDEELLLQYALEIGLARSVPAIRHQLIAAVLEASVAQADAQTPSEQTLQDFHTAHSAFFSHPDSVRVQVISADALPLALAARAAWLGNPAATFDDLPGITRLDSPSAALPATKLAGVLGAKLATVAQDLSAGEISAPVPLNDHYYLVFVSERNAGTRMIFEAARPLVLREWQRRQSETLLQETLLQLRERGTVVQRDVQ